MLSLEVVMQSQSLTNPTYAFVDSAVIVLYDDAATQVSENNLWMIMVRTTSVFEAHTVKCIYVTKFILSRGTIMRKGF